MLGKRRLKNAMTGRAVPVKASTARKKNSQRGPTVGRVLSVRIASPPQPTAIIRTEAGKKDWIEGEDRVSIGLILS